MFGLCGLCFVIFTSIMWISVTLFLFSLAGLVALFSLKAFERAGKKMPLARLRSRGDAFITNDLTTYGKTACAQCVSLGKRGYFLCRERTFALGSSLLASLHNLTLRLGEYLRKRKALPPHETDAKGSVSFYLKNVLEYKKTHIDADTKTQIDADKDADSRG